MRLSTQGDRLITGPSIGRVRPLGTEAVFRVADHDRGELPSAAGPLPQVHDAGPLQLLSVGFGRRPPPVSCLTRLLDGHALHFEMRSTEQRGDAHERAGRKIFGELLAIARIEFVV
jgi:hypothetical protein